MTLRNRNFVLAASLVALTGFAFTAQSARTLPFGNPLRISMNAEVGNAGLVQFKVTNTSKQAVKIPSWQLPSGALNSDLFEVYLDGQKVEYIGAMIKRGAVAEADLITLRAGETKLVTADLSQVYDMSQVGEYSVRFKSYLQGAKNEKGQALTSSNGRMALLQTPAMRMHVDSALPVLNIQLKAKPVTGTVVVNGVSFVGCTTSQQASAGSAVVEARKYTENSKLYLNAGTTGPRYTTWFGSYTSARYGTAQSHFSSIDTAMDQSGGAIKINCGCKQSYYAYVYPNQPYQIYVCNAFWTAPLTGTDSKAGTLVHEMSHFDIVANTDDVVYGQTGAKNLAISNPTDALRNADSHEYFSENTPFQN